jgi:hypothetical protein
MLSRLQTLNVVAAGGLFALTSVLSVPASADQPLTRLGPVGPREPILAGVGGQRVIAFYAPERGECAVSAVMWKETGADAPYASTRVRISLRPGQTFRLDGADRHSVDLLCGADAASLAVMAPPERIVTGATGSN